MLRRIREVCMGDDDKFDGPVEVDENCTGGKREQHEQCQAQGVARGWH